MLTSKADFVRYKAKDESRNEGDKKTKHAKFSEKLTFLTPWYAHVYFSIGNPFEVKALLSNTTRQKGKAVLTSSCHWRFFQNKAKFQKYSTFIIHFELINQNLLIKTNLINIIKFIEFRDLII